MKVGRFAVACCACMLASLGYSQYTSVGVRVNGLVYDHVRGRLYGAVPGIVPVLGNCIIVVDPSTAIMESATWIGSDPNPLALSESCDTLYIGLDGSGRIVEFDVETWTVVRSFSIGSKAPYGPMYADDIDVMPGTENVIAVVRDYIFAGSARAGVGVFEDGVLLPTFDLDSDVYAGAFGATPDRYYGTGGNSFHRYSVDQQGITLVDTTPFAGFNLGLDLNYFAGRAVGRTGRAIEPEPIPGPIGIYPGDGFLSADEATGSVYFLDASGNDSLRICDIETFSLVRAVPLPPSASVTSLVRWGTSGIAYGTDEDLHIFRSSLIWRQISAVLEAFLVGPGVTLQGSMSSLTSSDDNHLVMGPGVVFSTAQPPVRLSINFTAPQVRNDFAFLVESRASSPSVVQSISLYNVATGAYEAVHVGPSTTTDVLTRVEVFDRGAEFIDPATRSVLARVEYKLSGPTFVYPWQVRVDLVQLDLPSELKP